jgi:hypothetical protein
MTTCDECGEEFRTLTSAWGDATCATCLQARIDRALGAELPLGDRKPPRRASAQMPDAIGERHARKVANQ